MLDSLGHTSFYTVSVNCLYRDRVRVRGRVRDRVRFRVRFRVRVRRPDSSGNLLTWRKMESARLPDSGGQLVNARG